jgi:hypothetical protein
MDPMPDPTSHALIDPWISTLAAILQSGKVTAEELASPDAVFWPRVPTALLWFVQSLDLSRLAEVLRSNARFYRHPLVCRQIDYLDRLRYDEAEWRRLGWVLQYDEASYQWLPAELPVVNQWLERLVEAHVEAIFPHRRVRWAHKPKKRGPKSGFRNPHPAGDWATWVGADALVSDFRGLRFAFWTQLQEKKQAVPRLKAEARAWYRNLAQEVVAQLSRELFDFIEWSSLQAFTVSRYPPPSSPAADLCHPGPSAPAQPHDRELWLDTSADPYVLKRYDMASATWTTAMTCKTEELRAVSETVRAMHSPTLDEEYPERWKRLKLDAALDSMLPPGHKGDHDHSGKPAYLAYAVLGALLGVTPEKIRNTLDNFRHKRPPRQTR